LRWLGQSICLQKKWNICAGRPSEALRVDTCLWHFCAARYSFCGTHQKCLPTLTVVVASNPFWDWKTNERPSCAFALFGRPKGFISDPQITWMAKSQPRATFRYVFDAAQIV